MDKYDNRKCDYLKSDEWNYNQLQEMSYDVNIELNFLDNPALDTVEGRDYILGYFEKFFLSLPEHIIMHIVIGYIYKLKSDIANYEKHYNMATELFNKNKLSYNTFIRYLSWNHSIIKDFNQYVEARESTVC